MKKDVQNQPNQKYKGFWRYMKKYIAPYSKKLLLSAIGSAIVGIFVSIQPLVIKWIVDDGISNNALASIDKVKFIAMLCGFYILLSIGRIFIYKAAFINMLKSLEGALFNLRSHFFSHVQHLCMKFYDSTSVGELFNCIMGSPMTNIKSYMHQMFLSVPYQAVSLAVSLFALSSYDIVLTLIMLVTAIIMALFNVASKKKVRGAFRDYVKTESDASHYLNDTLHGMDAIKLYSIEENTFKEFQSFITDMYQKGIKASTTQALESYKPELVQFIGTAVVYLVGSVACIYRGLSVGTLYAFLSSMGIILNTLISWLNLSLTQSSAEAGLHKILAILDMQTTTPEIDGEHARSIDVEKSNALRKNKPCISFENVTFGYDNRQIFNNFSCDINYNESVALVGGSGSGKSTFTKLAMRLYDIQSGKVCVHVRDVRQYNLHDLRVTFGVVPQNPYIFYGTIWDNIMIARPDATNKEIIEAMEIAHVHDFVNELEHGWNTIVGDGALGLSGGQKQRIAIARAILGNPDILIFDEATSALDNISERHIQQAMETLMKTHTVIIVAHRLSTIKNVDRILVFDNGEIVQEGTYDELSKADGAFKELLNAQ